MTAWPTTTSSDRAGVNVTSRRANAESRGPDLRRYADRLRCALPYPALRHRAHGELRWMVARRLPRHMLDSVRWHLANHSDFDLLALGVAGCALRWRRG